jgi:PAS domain-containing protein
MTLGPVPDISEVAEFVETVRDHRDHAVRVARVALDRVGDRAPEMRDAEIADLSRGFQGIIEDLETATEELQTQGEALFAAHAELDDSSAFFRDLFELAPCAYLVTTTGGCITYANEAASLLLQRARNALVGKPLVCFVPLGSRGAFRVALARCATDTSISSWPLVLSPSGSLVHVHCRARVRLVTAGADGTSRMVLFWIITEETDEDLF